VILKSQIMFEAISGTAEKGKHTREYVSSFSRLATQPSVIKGGFKTTYGNITHDLAGARGYWPNRFYTKIWWVGVFLRLNRSTDDPRLQTVHDFSAYHLPKL